MGLEHLNEYANGLVRDSMKQSLSFASSVNPDEEAETRNFATRNKIPASLVPKDKTQRQQIDARNYHDLPDTHPKTAAFLSNLDNAKVSHDDVGTLKKMEDVLGTIGSLITSPLRQAFIEAPRAVGAMAGTLVSGGNIDQALQSGTESLQEDVAGYKPKTGAGELTEKVFSYPFKKWSEAGEYMVNPNSPTAALQRTAWEFMPYLLGGTAAEKATGRSMAIKSIADIAKESKVRGRAKEAFKEHVKSMGVEDISMPVEKFEDLMKESNLTPEMLLTDPANYHEAKGGSVQIPIEDFAANLADHVTDEHIKDMRIGLEDSVNEAAEPVGFKAATDVANKQTEGVKANDSQQGEAAQETEVIRPAVKRGSDILTGIDGARHTDIVPRAAEKSRGFLTPEGDFINRSEASEWLKDNRPDLYDNLSDDAKEMLHSEDLWQAQGIERPGPGAMTAASKNEAGSEISQLRSTIPKGKPDKPGVIGQAVADAIDTISTIKDTAKKSFEAMKDIGQKIWKGYKKPSEWTQYKDMLGEYMLNRQKSGMEAAAFAKDIQENIHPRVQEAITNWIEAGGDMDILRERAEQSNGKHQQGYADALRLDADHIRLAENIRNYFDSRMEQAIEAGVIDAGVENYIHRIWDRSSKVVKRITSEVNAGIFQTNPKLAKKRIFETFFEGEQLGYVPKDKRVGYLLTAYDVSMNEAIAARSFIKDLLHGEASDGRPLVDISGSGKQIEHEGTGKPDSYMIRPKSKGADSMDYRAIDHPALRKWKWATKDVNGNPIFVQGDLLVHPEIYRHLHNVLSKSKIREFELGGYHPGAALLNGIQTLKSTLLSLSAFHQVQEGVHAVGHEVNPFRTGKIDLTDPLQADLVKHGVVAFSHNALSDFAEGVHAAGLVSKIPGIGRHMQMYGEYLFQGYIPRLKMEMATHAFERNTKRYAGKLNRDQILELTAKQANAAFGELNYTMMGRSKTIQDMFRLVALAPDFLEARAKFVGQALKPYGREQGAALIRLSAYMAITAQVTNYLLNGEADWTRPFSMRINDKYYTLRSVPGDLIHLVTDPRSFTYHRLNPTIARPVIEALTGRDQFGRKRNISTQMADWVKSQLPIPVQGPMLKHDITLIDSILQSMGIGSFKKK